MKTNSKVRTYFTYGEIPKRENHRNETPSIPPYKFLKKFYGLMDS